MADLFAFHRDKPEAAKQVSVRVTADQYDFLGELAAELDMNKADLFRLAIEDWLASGPHAKKAAEVAKRRAGK